jgi:predicted metalloprotease with PDZ domain
VGGEAAIISSPMINASPLYQAGLERGDEIVKLGRRSIRSNKLWIKALAQYEPGDTANIEYIQRGFTLTKQVTFVENPKLIVSENEDEDEPISEQQQQFLDAWLGQEKP